MEDGNTISIEDIEYKEFTVAEIRKIISEAEQYQKILDKDAIIKDVAESTNIETTIDLLLPDGLGCRVVAMATGLKLSDMSGLKPSELRELQKKTGEANPFFLGMYLKMVSAGREILERQSKNST